MASLKEVAQSGRYVVHEQIGAGALGRFFLSRAIGEGGFAKLVVVKQLHPHLAGRTDAVAALLVDAQTMARVHHANVLSPIDIVVDGPGTLVIMEYVHGAPLSVLLQLSRDREREVPPSIASSIALDALTGFTALHEAAGPSIGARTVRPHHILVGTDGLARLGGLGENGGPLAEGGLPGVLSLSGTPFGGSVATWSLVVAMWELFTGAQLDDATASHLLGRLRPGMSTGSSPLDHGADLLEKVVKRAVYAAHEPLLSSQDLSAALEAAVAPAAPSAVGGWVRSLAKNYLRERRALINRVELAYPTP